MSIDTINDLPPRVQYIASAAQTVFPYPFPIFQDADLIVEVNAAVQTLTTHYTVSGEGDDTGGNVTFVTGLTAGDIVTIYRQTVIERDSDFQLNGPMFSTSVNDEFDKLIIISQELRAAVRRCLRIPNSAEVEDADIELTPISMWANQYLTFDANGKPVPAALVAGTITQTVIGQLLNPQTLAEQAAGMMPVNFSIPSHEKCGWVIVERFKHNTTPGTTDMAEAINDCISLAQSSRCGKVTSVSNLLAVSATVELKSYVKLDLAYGETAVGGGTEDSGTWILWAGSNGGTIMSAFNARMFEACGFTLHANTRTGLTGFLLDCDNNPSGSQNTIHHFSIRECLKGVQWGTSGILGGSFANDGTEFHTFTVWSSEALSDGWTINSGNAGQMSVIRNGGIQTQRRGIDIQVANILKISQVFGGGVMDDAFIRLATGIGVTIEGCSSECWGIGKTWRTNKPKFLRVVKPVGAGSEDIYPIIEATINLIGNQINNPVELGYPARIASVGNSWGLCQDYVTDVFEGAMGLSVAGPEWSAVTNYVLGDVVTRLGKPYFCIAANLNQAPPNATYWSLERGKSRVSAVNEGVNPGSFSLTTNEPVQGWIDSNYVHLSLMDPGRPMVRPDFNAAVFDAAGATGWTVASTDVESFEYKLIERMMFVSFRIVTSTVTDAASSELRITIPNGKIAARPASNMVRILDNGVFTTGEAMVEVGDTFIRITRSDGATFAAATNTTQVKGQLQFMVE